MPADSNRYVGQQTYRQLTIFTSKLELDYQRFLGNTCLGKVWPRPATLIEYLLTHVDRGDYFVNMLAEWNRCLYWFHPLATWLIRRLANLAER